MDNWSACTPVIFIKHGQYKEKTLGTDEKLRGHLKSPYAYYLMLPALLVYALLFVLPALSGLLLSFLM